MMLPRCSRVLLGLAASGVGRPPVGRRLIRVGGLRAMANHHAAGKPGLPKGVEWAGASGPAVREVTPSDLAASGSPFCVLGIETSCDDTGVAVVRSDGTILGEALASQAELHEEWGGVMPGLARDAHAEALDRVTAEALRRAGMDSVADVDAVAVTVG